MNICFAELWEFTGNILSKKRFLKLKPPSPLLFCHSSRTLSPEMSFPHLNHKKQHLNTTYLGNANNIVLISLALKHFTWTG